MKKTFVKLTIKFFDFINKKQNDKHKKRIEDLKRKILTANCGDNKVCAASGATLVIKAKSESTKQANKEKIEKIVSMYLNEPRKLFDYIKGAKTPVYINKYASKILSKINEDEGFILPKKGLKALYLNLIFNKRIGFDTTEMFIISSYNVNIYAFIYQFYNWYCYKMNLNGYDTETQENFKHVFEICETSKINNLSFEEIIGLKNAIRRDIEAIEFVKQLAVKNSISKKCLEKIKQGKALNI